MYRDAGLGEWKLIKPTLILRFLRCEMRLILPSCRAVAKIGDPQVHCSITHSGQDMETSKVSFDPDWLKMWSIHTMERYSTTRKSKCCHLQQHRWTWLSSSLEYHAEWNKSSGKAKNHMISHIHGYKTETVNSDSSVAVARGEVVGSGRWVWKVSSVWWQKVVCFRCRAHSAIYRSSIIDVYT